MKLKTGKDYTLKINKKIIHANLYSIDHDDHMLFFDVTDHEYPSSDIIIDFYPPLEKLDLYTGNDTKVTIKLGKHGKVTKRSSKKRRVSAKKRSSKKRSSKKRRVSTKKRSSKKRSTKKRHVSSKKRSSKKRSTKKRSSKKRSTKKRSSKKLHVSSKKRSSKKRSTKKRRVSTKKRSSKKRYVSSKKQSGSGSSGKFHPDTPTPLGKLPEYLKPLSPMNKIRILTDFYINPSKYKKIHQKLKLLKSSKSSKSKKSLN
jgi:hypothetical protein